MCWGAARCARPAGRYAGVARVGSCAIGISASPAVGEVYILWPLRWKRDIELSRANIFYSLGTLRVSGSMDVWLRGLY